MCRPGKFLFDGERGVSAGSVIRPLSRAERKVVADLASRQGRRRQGRFLLEGPRAIEEAAGAGANLEWIVAAPGMEDRVTGWIEAGRLPSGIRVSRVTHAELAELADSVTPQGVLAVGALPPSSLESLPSGTGGPVLVVDRVQDPGNLGTLFRTAAAVGGKVALCLKGTVDPWNPKVLRGSAGSAFRLAIAAGVDSGAGLAWCAAHGLPLMALVPGASDLFALPDRAGAVAVVVGNESGGLSEEIVEEADLRASIPMASGVDSLSVAVAGSIALYVVSHRLVRNPKEVP